MEKKEKTSPCPIFSHQGRKGQRGEQKSPSQGGFNSSPVSGEARRGNGLSRGTGRKAFTLVELIIVITILAILATIAFISFQGYTSKSRDANRASTAKNIETGLGVFQAKSGVYPIQSTGGTISLSGTKVTMQGNLDESIARVINLSEVPRDPKTGEMYHYISDTAGRGGKVLYYLENTPEYAFLTQSFAESEARTPIVKGEGPGVVFQDDELVSEGTTDFFLSESGASFTILVDDTTEVTGSGLELGGGFQMFALKGGRLEAPKTCPTGFIPVPGNAEFLQPGFCVAKYEMGYENITVPNSNGGGYTDWNTVKYSSTGTLVSKAGLYPIADISQSGAIAECQRIGKHLITNNEWMTIARNIEANGVNWSGGVVGINHIFNGASNSLLGCGVGTTKTIYSGSLTLDRNRATKTGPGGNANCDAKRQLKLSNGETVWDLAGNVREHVNKSNTISGYYNDVGHTSIALSSSGTGRDDDGKYSLSDMNKYGSSLQLGTDQGMGNISYADGIEDDVFVRGGDTHPTGTSGIFAMFLNWKTNYISRTVGFRCAY